MTPAELRATLERFGISQVRAAKILGVDDRSLRRWVLGEAPIPILVERVLDAASRGRLRLEDLLPPKAGDK